MKHTLILPILLGSLAVTRAQDGVRLPSPAPGQAPFFAQARGDEGRDRSNPRPPETRPPGVPVPPPPGERREGYGRGEDRVMFVDSRGRTARPIIVTGKPLDAKELAVAEEDLGIMARLLEKEIEREAGAGGPPNAMGIVLTRLDGRGPSVMLLEGYGAVFTFTTRMALTPPPARPAEKPAERPTDSPWERTRRELFGQGAGGTGFGNGGGSSSGGGAGGGRSFSGSGGGSKSSSSGGGTGTSSFSGSNKAWAGRTDQGDYDAKRVEELKKSVLEALKQASNIRALKADDYVTVVVQGQGGGSGHFGGGEFHIETRTTSSSSVNGEPPKVETRVIRDSGPVTGRAGTLTVRAKKSDCEEFAKGKLTAEQFAKKALLNLH
jgi:hypothetical protein